MDERRIERALREGPPGEDGYLPRPIDMDAREPRRRVSTRSPLPAGLALAVVALLIGLAALGRGLVPGSGPSVFGGAAASASSPATVPPATPPVGSPRIPPATPAGPSATAPAPDVRACRAADLHGAVVRWSGSLEATIRVTNTATSTCRAQGRPGLQLIDGLGFPVGSGSSAQSTPSVSAADPVVVLRPGKSAVVGARWTSWCGNESPKGPVAFRLTLPSSAGSLVADPDWAAARQPDPPACRPGAPSGPVVAAPAPFEADQGAT